MCSVSCSPSVVWSWLRSSAPGYLMITLRLIIFLDFGLNIKDLLKAERMSAIRCFLP